MSGIVKRFPGVLALDRAELAVAAGEVHVLFGENGAGKSTLINVIAGVFSQDEGELAVDGVACRFRSVHEARARGIGAMFQEFSLAPHLSVEQNLVLGAEPSVAGVLRPRVARERAREILAKYRFAIAPDAPVLTLSRAEQQMVEMAKVMLLRPRILILDEPTASLTETETARLFETVRELRADGVAIVYITHRMREITEIADRVTVMRDGRYVDSLPIEHADHDTLVRLMTGREVGDLYPARVSNPGATVLELASVSSADGRVGEVDLHVRAGEIVGVAGLVGCGKSELGRLCFGLGEVASGHVRVDDEAVVRPTPRDMLARGVCFISSDRRSEGLMLQRCTSENISVSALGAAEFSRGGVMRLGSERTTTHALATRMDLRPLNLAAEVANYSGGNQQKIIIARALATRTRLLIFDEPTVGVDVGARVEIYRSLVELAAEGCAILLISSDMPEIIHLCHRSYVVSRGRIVDELSADEAGEDRLLNAFFTERDGETP